MKKKYIQILLFILMLSCQTLFNFALDPDKAITQYINDVWQLEDGLPQSSITAIVQTRDGYIWIGTQEGLVRFDGVQFTVFDKKKIKEIKNNYISALFEDREGALWIGTFGGGLNRLKDGKFKTFTKKDGLSNDLVRCICEGETGSLWIGTNEGLNRFENERFTIFTKNEGLSNNMVKSLFGGSDGSLWIGTDGGGLNRLKDGKFNVYTTKHGLSNNFVWAIFEDGIGNLWIGTNGGGLNRLKDGKFTVYTRKEGLSNNFIWSIYEDKKNNLWIGTNGGGLNRLKDGIFSNYTTKEGLSENFVMSIFEDREESLWIGTYGAGLNRLRDGKFTLYTTREGLSNNTVWSICESRDGSLWIGTNEGVNQIKNGKVTTYNKKNGLSNNIVRTIYEDSRGSIWIGTEGGGLNCLKDGKVTVYTTKEGIANNIVWSICESRDKSLWIGTNSGLNRLKDRKFTVYTRKDGLSYDVVRSIYEDSKGNLWIGTEGGGLNRFRDGKFTSYTTKDGLSSNIIPSIYEDMEENLWLGTLNGGLIRFKSGKFTVYTTNEGLYNDNIYEILEDRKGNLWMSCNKGIFRVSKKELKNFAEGKIKFITCISYDKADGMMNSECNGGNKPSGCKTRDGKLLFPTLMGAAMIDPENLNINDMPPPVIIERVIVENKSIKIDKSIRFSPGKRKFEFHYSGLSYLVPDRVKFMYKLEGFEEDWVDAGTRRIAYYTNIPPGSYTFKVIACNNDNIWNNDGASFDFYLRPFIYQTGWFVVVLLLVGLSLICLFFRLRIRKVEAQKRKLELVVAKRTSELKSINNELNDFAYIVSHDLKAPLRGINQLTSWILQDYAYLFDKEGKEQMNLIISRVKRMNNLIEGILQYSRVGRIKEKENNIEINSVVQDIKEMIADPEGIKLVKENELPVIFASKTRIEQVFQNLIGNAVKYMDKEEGEIRVGCVEEGSYWKFWVADNGPGIEDKYREKIFQIFQTLTHYDEHDSTGIGLTVVKKIVEIYGGKIWVESKVGEGSTFYFTFPKTRKKPKSKKAYSL